MPLSRFVNEQLARFEDFLSDPDALLLEVRSLPEQRVLVTKLLLGIAQRADALFGGVDLESSEAATTCAAMEAALLDLAEQAQAVFDEDGCAFAGPRPDPTLTDEPETRVAVLGERLAREVQPVLDGVVLVLGVHFEGDVSPLATTLVRIATALESGRFKIVLIADRDRPVLASLALPRPRRAVPTSAELGEVASLVDRLSKNPLARVLVCDVDSARQASFAEAMTRAAAGRLPAVHVHGVRFWSPVHFYGRCLEQIVPWCERAVARAGNAASLKELRARVEHPLGSDDAEILFMRTLEEVVEAWQGDGGRLLVVLTPDLSAPDLRVDELDELLGSIERLNRAAVTPRIRVVIAGPGLSAERHSRTPQIRIHDVVVDGPVIQSGIEERLRETDLPVTERLRLTSALSSCEIATGDPERGLELGLEALALAQRTESPEEVAIAHFALGSGLYQCMALAEAASAYTSCLEIALDRGNLPLAAQALTGIGNCRFVCGDDDAAIEAYTVARTYFSRSGNAVGQAYVVTWLGEAYARKGDLARAEGLFGYALRLYDRAGDGAEHGKAEVLQRLARVQERLGRHDAAAQSVAKARATGACAPVADQP